MLPAILPLLCSLLPSTASAWDLLLRQTYGAGYFSYSDWYVNTHNQDAQLYSRLGDLEQFRGSDGSFHLYLYYPELGRGNEWKQTSNPVSRRWGGVEGYQAINISFSAEGWGGLEFNNQLALLDGTVDETDHWWYAVGSFGDFNGGIPGGDDAVVHEVELYVQPDIESRLSFGQIFQSGMVLQADEGNTIWGYSTVAGEEFTLELFKEDELMFSASSVTQDDLTWKVLLPSQEYGTGYRLIVTGQYKMTIDDLSFGEVWVCSGQSNMEFQMFGILDSEMEISNSAGYEDVRFTKLNYMTASEEMSDVWGGLSIPWGKPSDSDRLGRFSAVCFLFGRHLFDELQVPIGLIESSWGGTRLEAWSPANGLEACSVPPSPDLGAGNQNEDSQLWHAMIAPLTRLTIKGAIWYQGEANVWYNTDFYACAFSQMIDNWRQVWSHRTNGGTSQQFPFGLVQLGTNAEQVSENNPNSNWPLIRWHQTGDEGFVPNSMLTNTFMATAMDTHDPNSPYGVIHPRDKLTVATRLAWACFNRVYYRHEYPSKGPQPHIVKHEDDTVEVVFDQPVEVISMDGWQVCTAADVHLCSTYLGWKDVSASSSSDNSVTLDLGHVCGEGCSALAYLWRETPCLTPLECPVYSVDTFRLPATPWIFALD